MRLEKFCKDSWIIKKGRLRQSRHCEEIDLYSLIKQFQDKTISEQDKEKLLRCAMCGIGKVQKVWKELRKSLVSSFMICSDKKNDFLDGYFSEIAVEVLKCIEKFDLKKVEHPDNFNVMSLLSRYTDKSLHSGNILKKKIVKQGEEIDPDNEKEDIHWKGDSYITSKIYLERILKDVREDENGPLIDDFINEAKTGQSKKSNNARQQKIRLRRYIQNRWELSDDEAERVVNAIQHALENRIIT